ncbi:MAG: hypothetical protein E6J58_12410 [Deltaproteobacteria bacterium]|nr:MAG: hypothetical protein E6J67_18250 [Deltaproteobacteria bacterium]TMB37402.1 MAG: hypothetical protein E6J58_12410 [Deltaproteobacteria bacterium]
MLAGIALPAHADVGVPMLAVMWPPAWLLLLAIVPAEGYFARRILSLDWRSALGLSLRANLVSTLVGIPLTWFVLLLVEFGTGYAVYLLKVDEASVPSAVQRAVAITVLAPWLGPGDGLSAWIVPAAAAYLCIPFFFASVLIENRVALRRLGPLETPRVRKWSWYANGFSYSIIFACLVAWAIGSALSKHGAS